MRNISDYINESILSSAKAGKYAVLDKILKAIYREKWEYKTFSGHTKSSIVIDMGNRGEQRSIAFGKYSVQMINILKDFDGIIIQYKDDYFYPQRIEFEGLSGNIDLSVFDFTDNTIGKNAETTFSISSYTDIVFKNCTNLNISKLPKCDNSTTEVTIRTIDSTLNGISKVGSENISFSMISENETSTNLSSFTNLDVFSNCNFNNFYTSVNYFKCARPELLKQDFIAEKIGNKQYINNEFNSCIDEIFDKRVVKQTKLRSSKKSNVYVRNIRLDFGNLRKSNIDEYKYMIV